MTKELGLGRSDFERSGARLLEGLAVPRGKRMAEDGLQANAHEMTALEWVAYCSLVYVVCGTAYRAIKMMFAARGMGP